jgi:hypothetical protein
MLLTPDTAVLTALALSTNGINLDCGPYDVSGWDNATIILDASSGLAGFNDGFGITARYYDRDGVLLTSRFLGAARAGDAALVFRFRHLGPWVIYRLASYPANVNGTGGKLTVTHSNRPMNSDGPHTPSAGGTIVGAWTTASLIQFAIETHNVVAYCGPAQFYVRGLSAGAVGGLAALVDDATGGEIEAVSLPGSNPGMADQRLIWVPPTPCHVSIQNSNANAQSLRAALVAVAP